MSEILWFGLAFALIAGGLLCFALYTFREKKEKGFEELRNLNPKEKKDSKFWGLWR